MYKNKKFLAIIPARSGSKGLPDKNIKPLAGKPMLAYSIEAAKVSGIFDKIVVSTDSQNYADIAQEWGAEVPELRPESLSHDTAATADVITYTLELLKNQGETYDYFAILQPTSPLRTGKHLKDATDSLLEHKVDAVIGVCACDHPSEWNFKESKLDDLSFFNDPFYKQPRQKHENSYRLNGAVFLVAVPMFEEHMSYYGGTSLGFVMSREVSVDVDSPFDFMLTEFIISQESSHNSSNVFKNLPSPICHNSCRTGSKNML